MFALIKQWIAQNGVALSSNAERSYANKYLRPYVRRFQKYSSDILAGDVQIPRNLGTLSTLTFFSAVISYGVWIGGHSQAVMRDMTSTAGFSIEEIRISGNHETSDIDILQKLALDETSSLVTFSLNSAYQELQDLPWVDGVEIRKIYPATLQLKLSEREPFAIWQHGNQLSFIDRAGDIIDHYDGVSVRELPVFVGLGADQHAVEIHTVLQQWPSYYDQTKAFIRVADRRWDIRLQNGITLNLPETNVELALAQFEKYDQAQNILERDIAEVDLRLNDRMSIRLTQDALERRNEALDARDEMLKKEERS